MNEGNNNREIRHFHLYSTSTYQWKLVFIYSSPPLTTPFTFPTFFLSHIILINTHGTRPGFHLCSFDGRGWRSAAGKDALEHSMSSPHVYPPSVLRCSSLPPDEWEKTHVGVPSVWSQGSIRSPHHWWVCWHIAIVAVFINHFIVEIGDYSIIPWIIQT